MYIILNPLRFSHVTPEYPTEQRHRLSPTHTPPCSQLGLHLPYDKENQN